MSKLVLDKQYPKAIKYHISYTISIALVRYTYINRNLCKWILQMFLRIKQSHIHICVYEKYVFFSNPMQPIRHCLHIFARNIKTQPNANAQSLLWAVHFLHDQLKPSIGEEQVVNN